MADTKRTHARYWILFLLFFVSSVSYGDRISLSLVGPILSKQFGLDSVTMGYILSAFGWAYVAGQLPAGGLLDRFGSKPVYGLSIFAWAVCGLLLGFTSYIGPAAVAFIFVLRLVSGLAQAPVFPANGRIVSAWFPAAERGTASAVFNSSQYFSLVLFSPILGSLAGLAGWKYAFFFMGSLAVVLGVVWFRVVYSPKDHPGANAAELEYIAKGGGLVDMDSRGQPVAGGGLRWSAIRYLLGNRMLVGIYLGQYCITTLTWFFLTWFPIYLVQGRGMSILKMGFAAALPALCGAFGGVLGGVVSDWLLRRGYSLTVARKTPIVTGMLLAVGMIACNYVSSQWAALAIMGLAFFGKGFGSLGWSVISDASPKEIVGLSGSLFNMFGNLAAITTPIVIGYIRKETGSFNGALVYVGVMALIAMTSYLWIVGDIKRVELPHGL